MTQEDGTRPSHSWPYEKEFRKIRPRILKRDNSACRKCQRRDALEVHHINPRRAGGLNAEENLITLCEACHREWDMMECSTKIPFDQWIPLPTARHLLMLFMYEPMWRESISAADLRQEIIARCKGFAERY